MYKLKKHIVALVLIIVFSIIIRIIFIHYYDPYTFNDTKGYKILANQLKELDFSKYTGERTPVYPLFLLFGNLSNTTIWYLQLYLGVLITIILFVLAWTQTKNLFITSIVSLSYTLSINLLFFEANILTETLSIFWLSLFLLVTQRIFFSENPSWYYYCLGGIVISLAALTRPLLVVIIPLGFLFFIPLWKKTDSHIRRNYIIAFLLPVVIFVAGWSTFNKIKLDYFGLTTLTGFNLLHHSHSLVQYAPDEYAAIRDVYLKDTTKSMWLKIGEMRRVSGLSFAGLSKTLSEMSLKLFFKYPTIYLKSVWKAWIEFWDVANYWNIYKPRFKPVSSVMQQVWKYERLFLWGVNMYFLVVSSIYIVKSLSKFSLEKNGFILLIISIVLLSSFTQALIQYGENARYCIPFQSMIFYVALITSYDFLKKKYL